MSTIGISVGAQPEDAASWLALARRVDQAGFTTLYTADHPGTAAAPFVALAAAAAVTERVALGPCVVNAGLWEPIVLASEVATLDVVSGGRALLGLGAGHTPAEWAAVGRTVPAPGARVDRLVQVVDVVGVTGLGRTLADGHRHAVAWAEADLDESFGALHEAIAAAGTAPSIEALVQHVEITDDPEAAAARLAARLGDVDPAHLLDVPYVWLGTVEDIAARLHRHRRRWGVDRYAVRVAALDPATEILRILQGGARG